MNDNLEMNWLLGDYHVYKDPFNPHRRLRKGETRSGIIAPCIHWVRVVENDSRS
jgi:hypothetical protein